jgi:hypothetical protein
MLGVAARIRALIFISVAVLAGACGGVKFSAQVNSPLGNNGIPPLLCSAGQPAGGNINYYPTACLVPPSYVPNDSMGVEINNVYQLSNKVFSMTSNDPVNGTSVDTQLYIENATYVAPDTIVITAYDAAGNATQLLNLCDISTYQVPDPTNGKVRPYSDTILQFNVLMPKGTVKLTFDYSNSTTQTYLGVWNLKEFSSWLNDSANNPFNSIGKPSQFRVQAAPLSVYNDNSDPLQSQPMCPSI